MIVQQDTSWWLEQWALWVMDDKSGPPLTPLAVLIESKKDYRETKIKERWVITEDQAMNIASIISRLYKRNQKTCKALMVFYLSKCNMRHTARKLGVTYAKADVLVNSGISWVDCKLSEQIAA